MFIGFKRYLIAVFIVFEGLLLANSWADFAHCVALAVEDRLHGEPSISEIAPSQATPLLTASPVVRDIPLTLLGRGKNSFKGNHWKELSAGKSLTYIVDSQGRIHLSSEIVNLTAGEPLLIRDSNSGRLIVPTEVGEVTYDPHTKKYNWEKNPDLVAADVNLDDVDERKGMGKEDVESCAKINRRNGHGWSFVATKIGADAMVQGAVLYSKGRFDTTAGRWSGGATGAWIVVHDIASSKLDLLLLNNTMGTGIGGAAKFFATALSVKYADAITEWFVGQKSNHLIMGTIAQATTGTSHDPGSPAPVMQQLQHLGPASAGVFERLPANESRSQKMADADFQYNLVRTPIGFGIDYLFVKKLPSLMMSLCQIDPRLTWIINSQTLRLADRVGNQIMKVNFTNYKVGDEFKVKEQKGK